MLDPLGLLDLGIQETYLLCPVFIYLSRLRLVVPVKRASYSSSMFLLKTPAL
jgi:hypothetical protein